MIHVTGEVEVEAGLKVYIWLWEHLCYQVYISRRAAKTLGVQQKMLGAQPKILGAPVPTEKHNLRHYYIIFSFFTFYFDPGFVVLTKADLLFV